MKKTLLITLSALVLAGCSTKTLQPSSSYMINTKAECGIQKNIEYRLTVETYNDELNTKSMSYTKGFEHQRYLYSNWSSSPVQMLQNEIFKDFFDCGNRIVYNDMQIADFNTTKNLRIVVQNFEQVFDVNGTNYGYLRAQAWLRDSKINKTKTFEIKVPSSSADAKGGVIALNKASTEFISELMQWTTK